MTDKWLVYSKFILLGRSPPQEVKILFFIAIYWVLREQLCLFAQRYKDTNSYLDNIGSKIRKDIIILATPSIVME